MSGIPRISLSLDEKECNLTLDGLHYSILKVLNEEGKEAKSNYEHLVLLRNKIENEMRNAGICWSTYDCEICGDLGHFEEQHEVVYQYDLSRQFELVDVAISIAKHENVDLHGIDVEWAKVSDGDKDENWFNFLCEIEDKFTDQGFIATSIAEQEVWVIYRRVA